MLEENSFASHLTSSQGRADLAREITDEVNAQLPEEKRRLEREMLATARETQNRASHWVEGLGQQKASIPPIAYLRWGLAYPGCWKDDAFEDEFLRDNPACCLNGYTPPPKKLYFDMASTPKPEPGVQIYHALKKQVGLPAGLRPLGKIVV